METICCLFELITNAMANIITLISNIASFILSLQLWQVLAVIPFLMLVFVYLQKRSWTFNLRIRDVSKKTVLITGCDTGFGFELALSLDKLGCHVIPTCLTPEGVKRLQEVMSSGHMILQMDVTSSDDIHNVYNQVLERLTPDKGKSFFLFLKMSSRLKVSFVTGYR